MVNFDIFVQVLNADELHKTPEQLLPSKKLLTLATAVTTVFKRIVVKFKPFFSQTKQLRKNGQANEQLT